MKTTRSSLLRLTAASAALCALSLGHTTFAQPAPTRPGAKTGAAKKPRGKTFTPRMVKATEAATGKPITPELKERLTKALRAREAAIQAANDAYYAEFAAATGLTPEEAKEIDKPARKTAKPATEPKTEGKADADEDGEDEAPAPTTPK